MYQNKNIRSTSCFDFFLRAFIRSEGGRGSRLSRDNQWAHTTPECGSTRGRCHRHPQGEARRVPASQKFAHRWRYARIWGVPKSVRKRGPGETCCFAGAPVAFLAKHSSSPLYEALPRWFSMFLYIAPGSDGHVAVATQGAKRPRPGFPF